ncbi:MAG: DNA (cytosine-5-)-methyltransferase [Gammaproteobacteria bacterium]|nr:DNA (cytosine-5-)-methyltransferase [Gammaproteobacteria bacterium]
MKNTQSIINILESHLAGNDETYHRLTAIELFAGAGGLALGFEQAGFKHLMLNEIDNRCSETLRLNRPDWPLLQQDIRTLDFTPFYHQADVVAGGFPCQSFSAIGKRAGFDDERGALFFEFARAIREIQPKIFIAENVKGLLHHKNGETLKIMLDKLTEAGYNVMPPRLLKAVNYRVPQLRERVFIVGVRSDLDAPFIFPSSDNTIHTLHDALKAGKLYPVDVPNSQGIMYSEKKREILSHVPEGGNWKNLPLAVQKTYMGKFYAKGSNTQVARRLAWNKPAYTLLTKPDSKLTERCHPTEIRPLTVREYARIQTFPDNWQFAGALSAQYKQIGNAVPINLALALALAIKGCLTRILNKESLKNENNRLFLAVGGSKNPQNPLKRETKQ